MLKPDIQHFAETPATDDEANKNKGAQTDPAAQTDPGAAGTEQDPAAADDGLPKTQAELDALIDKRLKREQKKWTKQQTTAAPAAAPAASGTAQPTAVVQPSAQSPATVPVDNSALEKTQKDLMESRAELAAYKSGVKPAAVEDAVLLAIHEVEKNGDELDDESVGDALKEVLKRHPEWKSGKDDSGSGFRVGAGSGDPQQANNEMLNEVFGLTT